MESDLVPYGALTTLPAKAVLVLAPHPDDEVFGCGGAIRRHVEANVDVAVVVLTDGAIYGDAGVRQLESLAAAKLLGYGAPEFWNFPDRGLVFADTLVQRLVEKIALNGVDLVYTPSPWEVHPDHQQACRLGVEAVRQSAFGVRLAFYEVGMPLWPNMLLDITALVDAKEAAMRCFGSQLLQQDYVLHMQALNRYRTYTLGPDMLAAEAYWLASPQELDNVLQGSVAALLSRGMLSHEYLLAATAQAATKPTWYGWFFQRLSSWWMRALSWPIGQAKSPEDEGSP